MCIEDLSMNETFIEGFSQLFLGFITDLSKVFEDLSRFRRPQKNSGGVGERELASGYLGVLSLNRLNFFLGSQDYGCEGGGSKTKEIPMKNIGVKILITNRIIWNSKQTKKKQAITNMSNQS